MPRALRRDQIIPAGAYEVPWKRRVAFHDPILDPDVSIRRAHLRRVLDLSLLLSDRGDLVRARRAWGILSRCWEAHMWWDCGIAIGIVEEDNRRRKRLRRSRFEGDDDEGSLLRERIKDPVTRLREQTLARIDGGHVRDALDQLELALPSQPYRSSALLHFYAGLCVIYTAQGLPSRPSVEERRGIGRVLGEVHLQRRWRTTVTSNRLGEARTYLETALQLLGQSPIETVEMRRELKQAAVVDDHTRSSRRRHRARPKADSAVASQVGQSDSSGDHDPYLRLAVLDFLSLISPEEAEGSDAEDAERPTQLSSTMHESPEEQFERSTDTDETDSTDDGSDQGNEGTRSSSPPGEHVSSASDEAGDSD